MTFIANFYTIRRSKTSKQVVYFQYKVFDIKLQSFDKRSVFILIAMFHFQSIFSVRANHLPKPFPLRNPSENITSEKPVFVRENISTEKPVSSKKPISTEKSVSIGEIRFHT